MVSTAPVHATIRFTTSGVPVDERLDIWRKTLRPIVDLDMETPRDLPFRSTAKVCALPGVNFAFAETTPFRCVRTPELAKEGKGDVTLLAISSGAAMMAHGGEEVKLGTGDAVLLRNGEPGWGRFTDTTRFFGLCISAESLGPAAANVGSTSPMPASGEPLRLLVGYARLLQESVGSCSGQAHQLAANHIQDLMALMVGAGGEAAERARNGGLRAARLAAIKADIAENLGRQDLSIDMVAARQGISPRYVQKLFGSEGTSFSEFTRALRLFRAQRMLTDPRFAGMPISSIAFEVGFSDLSYFNRCFRRRYGMSPSAMREEIGKTVHQLSER